MFRFFIDGEDILEDGIVLPSKDYNHIINVARIKPGEVFELVHEHTVYRVTLESEGSDIAKVLEVFDGTNEPETKVHLYFGILKGSKIDFVFQKCTEIGVHEFTPVEMDRSIVKTKGKERTKTDRWQKIVEEAAKQSKRDYVPKVNSIITSREMVEELEGEEVVIVPYELETSVTLKSALREVKSKKINVIVGPEGGIGEREVEELSEIYSVFVTLGNRILRGETASVVVGANIIYEMEQ